MKQKWKEWLPEILAVAIFMLVEIIDFTGVVPFQRRDKFELISNSAMFAVALYIFFRSEFSLRSDDECELKSICSNILVSAIAFPMNIGVFQHTIRREQFFADIWGVHLCWLLWMAVQILFLTKLGQALLTAAQGFLDWIKEIIGHAGAVLTHVFEAFEKLERQKLLVLSFGSLSWIVYLGVRIHIVGTTAALSDSDFWWESIWVWAISLAICFLVQIFPEILRKAIDVLQKGNSGRVTAAAILFVLVTVMAVYPPFFKTMLFLVISLFIPGVLLWNFVKKISQIEISAGDGDHEVSERRIGINLRDLRAVMFAFIFLPMTLLVLITAYLPDGRNIIVNKSLTDAATWIEFINAVAEVSKTILDL